MSLDRVENRRFGTGEQVRLDGKYFINCKFIGCDINYAGGAVYWQGVTWSDCNSTFVGAANHTVQVLQAIGCIIIPPPGQSIH